jgi:hypothetical protein
MCLPSRCLAMAICVTLFKIVQSRYPIFLPLKRRLVSFRFVWGTYVTLWLQQQFPKAAYWLAETTHGNDHTFNNFYERTHKILKSRKGSRSTVYEPMTYWISSWWFEECERGVTEQGMERGNNFMGLVTRVTNLGSPIRICTTLSGTNIFPYVYLVMGNPISDQTGPRLYILGHVH